MILSKASSLINRYVYPKNNVWKSIGKNCILQKFSFAEYLSHSFLLLFQILLRIRRPIIFTCLNLIFIQFYDLYLLSSERAKLFWKWYQVWKLPFLMSNTNFKSLESLLLEEERKYICKFTGFFTSLKIQNYTIDFG